MNNTLIVLGNGSSLKDVDFKLLANQDTFALNGSFLNFANINFYPKYYAMLPMGPLMWEDEQVINFINEAYHKIDRFFFFKHYFQKFITRFPQDVLRSSESQKMICVCPHLPDVFNIDTGKWALPYSVEKQFFLKKLYDSYPKEKANKMLKDADMYQIFKDIKLENLTWMGMYDVINGNPIVDEHYINKPRWKESWNLPKSFDDFSFSGGNSAVIATLLGYLMGYKKILLLGVDCEWRATDNIVNTEQSYWFKEYFNNNPYNIKEFCSKCTPESLQKMHFDSWCNLKETIDVNNLDFQVINCNNKSELKIFKFGELEREI